MKKPTRELRLILGNAMSNDIDYSKPFDDEEPNDDKLVFRFDFDKRTVWLDTDYEIFLLEESELCRLMDAMEMYFHETVEEE